MEHLASILMGNLDISAGYKPEASEIQKGVHVRFTNLTLRVKPEWAMVNNLTAAGRKNKGRLVLDNLTGSIHACKVTALMGPSGCGKSSLVSCITGAAQTYGTVGGEMQYYHGNAKREWDEVRRWMAFVPQHDTVRAE